MFFEDKKQRLLKEAWKKYEEQDNNPDELFYQAYELMTKAHELYDQDPNRITCEMESKKILEAMEDLKLHLTDPEGYKLK